MSYEDLRPGGVLGKHVNDFTFFPNFECNDAFLDLVNFTDHCEPGQGLCENLVRYSRVSVEERKEFQERLDAEVTTDADDIS